MDPLISGASALGDKSFVRVRQLTDAQRREAYPGYERSLWSSLMDKTIGETGIVMGGRNKLSVVAFDFPTTIDKFLFSDVHLERVDAITLSEERRLVLQAALLHNMSLAAMEAAACPRDTQLLNIGSTSIKCSCNGSSTIGTESAPTVVVMLAKSHDDLRRRVDALEEQLRNRRDHDVK